MDHLKDLFSKNEQRCRNLLHQHVTVTLKIDGTAFQVYVNNDNEIEYHKRSGNTSRLGPLIDEYTLLFVKSYSDAISHIEKYKDLIIKNWKFLTFEIFNDRLFILSAYDRLMNPVANLQDIAKKIGCDCVPMLFNGDLSDDQYDKIVRFCESQDRIHDFKQWVYDIFKDYNKFPKPLWNKIGNDIEGFVMNFEDGSQYKIDDPQFARMHKDMTAKAKEESKQIKPILDDLYKEIYGWMKNNAQKLGNDNWESLNMNFINMCRDEECLKRLLSISDQIPQSSLDLVDSKINPMIKKLMIKYGTPMKTLYWKYLYMMNKPKKRNYIVNKEFQQKVNAIINKIYEGRMGLHDFILMLS